MDSGMKGHELFLFHLSLFINILTYKMLYIPASKYYKA